MTLTEADVARLDDAGHRDFARRNRDGDLELRNRDGRCVFLVDGRCSVYQSRPEGCELYPLTLDLATGAVVRDRDCPFRDEFELDARRADRLRRSVSTEARERGRRRWSARD
jgi:Fe-S-cluster containining protein